MFGWVGFSFHTRRRRRQAGGAQHCGRLHNIFFSLPGWGLSFWRWRRGGWFLKQEREDRYKNAQKHKIKRGERGYKTQRRKQCSRIVFWHFSTCVLCGTVVVFAKTRRGFFLGNVLHRLFAKRRTRQMLFCRFFIVFSRDLEDVFYMGR